MSAFGGKADVRELPSVCPLIARSGHSSVQLKLRNSAASTFSAAATPSYKSTASCGGFKALKNQAVTPEDAFDVAEAISTSLNASALIRGGG